MAKSLSAILSQIERLQKEAASIQSEVIERIRKEIAKYNLTPEQLFGRQKARTVRLMRDRKPAKKGSTTRAAKYADGSGNEWGGMGKRPQWLRQALEAGGTLEDFLVGGTKAKAAAGARSTQSATKAKHRSTAGGGTKAVAKNRPAAKKSAARKPRAKAEAPAGQ